MLSFFSELVCNFRPFELNATSVGHSKILALWHFELPHASHIAQIRSIASGQFVSLCPFGSIAPLHFKFVRAFALTAFEAQEAPSVSPEG